MQQSLNFVGEKEFIKSPFYLGDQKVSPLTFLTIELLKCHLKNSYPTAKENIFWMGIPERESGAHLLAIGILIKQLDKDLKRGQIRKDLQQGMKICFFNTELAEFRSLSSSYLHIRVNRRQHNGYRIVTEKVDEHLPAFYADYCKPFNGNRIQLSTLKNILIKGREKIGNVRPIDKLLIKENVQENRVPSGHLSSKVLVIAGRNGKKKFLENLKGFLLFEVEPFEIFKDYLIIQKDPSNYELFFSSQERQKRERFNKYFIEKLENFAKTFSQGNAEIEKIIDSWKNGIYEKDSLQNLKSIILHFKNTLPSFFISLENSLPISNPIPRFLKLLIINSPEIYVEYRNTIDGMAGMGIKVCILYGLKDFNAINPEIFSNSPRFFWNRNKLQILNQFQGPCVDRKWFGKNINFSRQKIIIELSEDNELSDLYWRIYQIIKGTDGHENLKDFFWNIIFPTFHVLKNSPNISQQTLKELFIDINTIFNPLREYIKGETLILIEEFINHLQNFINPKTRNKEKIIWSTQEINLTGKTFKIPVEEVELGIPIEKDRNPINLSGIPFRDFEHNFLEKFIFEEIYTKIRLFLWPREYYSFIKKLNYFKNSLLFQDSLPSNFFKSAKINIPTLKDNLENYYMVNDHRKYDFREDHYSFPKIDEDEIASTLAEYKHSKYKGTKEAYTKECIVAQLSGNCWIYLPNKESSYTFSPNGTSIFKIKNKKIKIGSVLVLFKLSKENIRKSGESNPNMNTYFSILEIWENTLKQLFITCGSNYFKLKTKLEEVKISSGIEGSPQIYNLRRWLNEDDLTLNPRFDNLKMILTAGGIPDKIEEVRTAAAKIRKYEKKLKKNLQKEVVSQADIFFDQEKDIFKKIIEVKGVAISVTTVTVKSIETNLMEIENTYVGKIMGDKC